MKLKSFKIFESEEDIKQFGINPDELKWYFTDFIDDGFNIRIQPMSKLIDLKTIERPFAGYTLGEIKYIKVAIWKRDQSNSSRFNYRTFMNKQEFEDIILEANERLIDHGLYIQDIQPFGSQLSILIYREMDKKYLQ